MYQTLVCTVTFVLLCDIRVIISKPASEELQKLYLVRNDDSLLVEAITTDSKPTSAHSKTDLSQNFGKIIIEKNVPVPVVIETESAKQVINGLDQNPDTKKQYYLFKVKEFYDFLPQYRQGNDKFMRLEIVDKSDMGYSVGAEGIYDDDTVHPEGLVKRDLDDFLNEHVAHDTPVFKKTDVSENSVYPKDFNLNEKREISDETLRSFLNVFQTNFMKKRDINDLGDFSRKGPPSADQDDPENNNYKYIAYVPFFRVRKYYVQRKRLDIDM